MSTGYMKTFGEIEEEGGQHVIYHWNDRFEWLLEAVEVNGEMHWNPDFQDEYSDAKFDGGGGVYDAEAEGRWRE